VDDNQQKKGQWILVATIIIGVVACIWAIASGSLTDRESLLLGIVLTILSSVGSWISSHYYSEYSSSKNLKVFALKAAEKVTNLSDELDRLSVFLQQELGSDEYETPDQTILSRDARIDGAIHIITTLKSVNDRSLSDWQGAIGDEIIARREEQEEREEDLRELVDRVEALYQTGLESNAPGQHENTIALAEELNAVRGDIHLMTSLVSGVQVRRKKSLAPMENLEKLCPKCGNPVRYKQRPKINGYKSLKCKNCDTNLMSQYVDEEFLVQVRDPVAEAVMCPVCSETIEAFLDPMPGSAIVRECSLCRAQIRVYRTPVMVGVRVVVGSNSKTVELTEDFLQKVQDALPSQPWPKGTTRQIASELKVSVKSVSKAINELIKRDLYKVQVDGQLYEKI